LQSRIAKSQRGQLPTQPASDTHVDNSVVSLSNDASSACQQSEEKNSSSSCHLTAGGARGAVQEKGVISKPEEDSVVDVSLAEPHKSDSQSTGSVNSDKQTVDSHYRSAKEQNNPVVTLDQNLVGQLGKKFGGEKKEAVDSREVVRHGHPVTKDSRKSESLTSKSGTEQSHRRHRSSSDGSSSRQHHHRHHYHHGPRLRDKRDTRQTSSNGEQLVPPLKIRVEHRSKNIDQQTAMATYSVDSCGSENMADNADKTSEVKNPDVVPVSATNVTDNKTVRDVVPPDRDVSRKDDTHTSSDQRRTRHASAPRPAPLVTKRRLTFEESLIAGTCISTTASSAVTTDSVKISVPMPSVVCRETIHSVEESAQSVAKLTTDTKTVASDKKELVSNSTKKLKLEDSKSLPVQQLSGVKKSSDELKMKRRSSNSGSEDVKLNVLSHPIPVHKESESSQLLSQPAAVEVKCAEKRDPVSVDSKSKCMKPDVTGVVGKDEASMKNSSVGAGLVVGEQPVHAAKHSSSERTSHHHDHHHGRHRRHSSSSTKPHRMMGSHLDHELRHRRLNSNKYGSLMHIETHPNGGASVVHAFEDELSSLSPHELSDFVQEFFRIVFDEEPAGVPRYVMGIVHNSAAYLPDILEYFAGAHPDMVVKRNHLGKSADVETTTIHEYFRRVQSTYLAGTYRTGPLDHFSIVGTKAEETGGYFPEFLDLLDQNEFLKRVSPWGKMSELENMPRNQSNDGPIVWARPGEQVVPTADMPKSPMIKKR